MKPFVNEQDEREQWRARILRALAEFESDQFVERIRMEQSTDAEVASTSSAE